VTPQKKKRKQIEEAAAAEDGDKSIRTPVSTKRSGAPLRVSFQHTLGLYVLPLLVSIVYIHGSALNFGANLVASSAVAFYAWH
jgi:hypothetical protein